MLTDLHRERDRIDSAVADLLAARGALNAIIAVTPSSSDDGEGDGAGGEVGGEVGAGAGDDPDACLAAAPGETVTR